ncbi:hypothetical protein [Bacillus sp. FJAT-27225]|nr:hypothetical protein [Bacillus sp. FJAT-27225]
MIKANGFCYRHRSSGIGLQVTRIDGAEEKVTMLFKDFHLTVKMKII